MRGLGIADFKLLLRTNADMSETVPLIFSNQRNSFKTLKISSCLFRQIVVDTKIDIRIGTVAQIFRRKVSPAFHWKYGIEGHVIPNSPIAREIIRIHALEVSRKRGMWSHVHTNKLE